MSFFFLSILWILITFTPILTLWHLLGQDSQSPVFFLFKSFGNWNVIWWDRIEYLNFSQILKGYDIFHLPKIPSEKGSSIKFCKRSVFIKERKLRKLFLIFFHENFFLFQISKIFFKAVKNPLLRVRWRGWFLVTLSQRPVSFHISTVWDWMIPCDPLDGARSPAGPYILGDSYKQPWTFLFQEKCGKSGQFWTLSQSPIILGKSDSEKIFKDFFWKFLILIK